MNNNVIYSIIYSIFNTVSVFVVKRCLTDVSVFTYTVYMKNSERIEQLIELVLIEYAKSYDLEIAMLKAEVSDEDREIIEKDPDLVYRVNYEDALIREKIIERMVRNVSSSNPQLSQKAAVDLGNILYKQKFSKKDEPLKLIVPDKIVLVGAE